MGLKIEIYNEADAELTERQKNILFSCINKDLKADYEIIRD